MADPEQQVVLQVTVIINNEKPKSHSYICLRYIAKMSLLVMPWILDHLYLTWPITG
jgi:hypothetical protein